MARVADTAAPRPHPPSSPSRRETRTERAAREIRERILSFDLRPGEALQERRLEELLGMSRSPVRAALAQLASEGLVRREGRSFHVVSVDPADLDEIFAFRTLLETAAVRLAALRIAAEPASQALQPAEAWLRSAASQEGSQPALSLTERFHLALAQASGNRYIVEALEPLFPRIAQVRFLEAASPATRRQAGEEHARILELVRAGRGEEAANLMRAHLERTRRTFERGLARLGPAARLLEGGA